MNSLILDSSDKYLEVSIAVDNKIVVRTAYECWQKQSENMIPEIDKALKEANINPREINEVLVTLGPGSYTGVRIALTVAKVYAYALKIPCYAISSLQALEDFNKPSICLMNARSMRSYIGIYDGKNIIISDTIKKNDEVLELIKKYPTYQVCGDTKYLGIEGYRNNLSETLLALKDETNKVQDIMSLKAVYLKD